MKSKARIGKKISIEDKVYVLLPEKKEGCCTGCDLINDAGCTKEITDFCRQGYILKFITKNVFDGRRDTGSNRV